MSEDNELITEIKSLLGEVGTQNTLIAQLPEISFRVKILWSVFGIVCASALVGFLGLVGYWIVHSGGA